MGNHVTHHSSNPRGKVILSNGRVQEFEQPLTVAELMMEYPQEVVVEFNPNLTTTQRRPTPLPADKRLDMNKVYLMLPVKPGKPPSLSSHETRHLLLTANSVVLSSKSRLLPLLSRICTAGAGQVEINDVLRNNKDHCVQEKKLERCALELLTQELLENRPDYLTRQVSGKGWKPSLDTIKEKKMEVKVPHWLF